MNQPSTSVHDLQATTMLQALPLPAFLLTRDLMGFQANAAFLNLMPEFPLDWEMVLNWVREKDRERVKATALFRLKGDQPFKVVFEATSRTGGHQWLQAHFNPLIQEGGVQGWVCTLEVLDQSKVFLQAIVDHLPMTLMVLDLDGEVKLMNEALSEVLSKGKDHYLGKNILEADPVYGPIFMEVLQELQEHPQALEPREYQTPQGQHWRTHHFPVKGPEGELLGVGSASLNVTGQKQAEKELQEGDGRMQRLVEGHQRFVSEVSHELKSPLAGIQGHLELLLRYDWLTREEKQEMLTEAHREVVRLGRLVTDLLYMARSGSGPLMLDTEMRFHEMLLLTVKDFERQQNTHHLTLGEVQPCVVCGDPDRLKQLLVILISNALKYTPEGGAVSLALRQEGDHVVLSITDTGVGIPAEDLEKVFERHYRARHEGFTDPGGSGLGLALAKWIVQEHHGKIWLESTVGVGTTVRVKLPVVQQ